MCEPLNIRKGKSGVLPVTTSKHVTWDTVTWKVLENDSELLEGFCQAGCDDMYNFKVGKAGVHRYLVEMRKDPGGVSLTCEDTLGVLGMFKSTCMFYVLNILITTISTLLIKIHTNRIQFLHCHNSQCLSGSYKFN